MRLSLFTVAAIAASARAVTVAWYEGADCTGEMYYSDPDADVGSCYYYSGIRGAISNHKSLRFVDVPHEIRAFVSGGAHDKCTNGFQASATGTGCLTAPDGYNWESFRLTSA